MAKAFLSKKSTALLARRAHRLYLRVSPIYSPMCLLLLLLVLNFIPLVKLTSLLKY